MGMSIGWINQLKDPPSKEVLFLNHATYFPGTDYFYAQIPNAADFMLNVPCIFNMFLMQ